MARLVAEPAVAEHYLQFVRGGAGEGEFDVGVVEAVVRSLPFWIP